MEIQRPEETFPAMPYRPNVGMVLFRSDGEVLVGERIQFPGAWQFPQGGIDPGEEPWKAAFREMNEEVGIRDAEFIAEYPDWLVYDFPSEIGLSKELRRFRGQVQKWFLFYWDKPITECHLENHIREFTSIRFMPFQAVVDNIVEFKKPTYRKLYEYFYPIIENSGLKAK